MALDPRQSAKRDRQSYHWQCAAGVRCREFRWNQMPNQRRMSVRRAPVQSRRRTTSRSQSWFSVLALLTVVAMLIGAVGSAVFLDLFDNGDDVLDAGEFDPSEEDEVEQQYREDLAARPDDPETIATLANYLSLTGKGDEAISLYERALAISPDNASMRLDFARALADGGSTRDAELQFNRVIEAEPENGLALLELARLYRDWSPPRTDESIATYQRVVATGQDSITVQIALEELAELGVIASPVASPIAAGLATPTAMP